MIDPLPWVQVVGESADLVQAVSDVERLQPDGILVAITADGNALPSVAEQLHQACTESRLLVFASEPDGELEIALEPHGEWAFLPWETVTQAQVMTACAAVLIGDLKVASPRAAEVVVRAVERRVRSREGSLHQFHDDLFLLAVYPRRSRSPVTRKATWSIRSSLLTSHRG